jgi:hypothetical protein
MYNVKYVPYRIENYVTYDADEKDKTMYTTPLIGYH